MTRFIRVVRLGVVAAIALIVVGGCGKSDSPTGKDINRSATMAKESGQEALGSLGDATKTAMDAVTGEFNTQLEKYKPQIDSLKNVAANFKDDKLNGLVESVQQKFNELKTKIDAAKGGDKAALDSLKSTGNALLADVKKVYDQAMARLSELKSPSGATK